jgi:phospholipid N-methyltransferase
VVITFLTLLVDFFVIARSLNEMNKITNLIAVAISKNPRTSVIWSGNITKNEILKLHNLQNFEYSISCLPLNCLSSPEKVQVTIRGSMAILGINFPFTVMNQSSISKFLSK